MTKYSLQAEGREIKGRKVKQLREEGVVPANIFGKGVDSLSIKLPLVDFKKVFSEAGETSIIDVKVGKDSKPTLVHGVQLDPVSGEILHIDFLQVDLSEKVTAMVPVELEGEAPASKEGKGVIVQQLDEIEVEALPTELPEKFSVDITSLEEVDDAVYVKDLKFDSGEVTLNAEEDLVIAKVEALREEEEPLPSEEETIDLEGTVADGEEGDQEEGAEGEEKEGSEEKASEEN